MAKAKAVKTEFNSAVHGSQLKQFIAEASGLKFQIESASDAIKDIRTRAKDELGLEPSKFNKLLALHHKSERAKFEKDNEEIIEVYDAVFTARS